MIEDDPELTVRHVKGRNPLRIVLDSSLRISPQAKIYRQSDADRTWVFTTEGTRTVARRSIERTGAAVFAGPAEKDGRLDLVWVVKTLSEHSVTSVLVEGGGTIHSSFIKAGLFDQLIVAAAPLLIGGDGTPAVADLGLRKLTSAPRFTVSQVRSIGDDIWIELERNVHGNR